MAVIRAVATSARHRHLQRLSAVWSAAPVYFITACVLDRRPLLASPSSHEILRNEWAELPQRHGWMIGRYVVMPDHVHFFAAPQRHTAKPLSAMMGKWKEWTAKRIAGGPIWQAEFFDHLIRSNESRSEKWNYVRENPVRAGLVSRAQEWPYAGAIHFE
jgi:putative transposase